MFKAIKMKKTRIKSKNETRKTNRNNINYYKSYHINKFLN